MRRSANRHRSAVRTGVAGCICFIAVLLSGVLGYAQPAEVGAKVALPSGRVSLFGEVPFDPYFSLGIEVGMQSASLALAAWVNVYPLGEVPLSPYVGVGGLALLGPPPQFFLMLQTGMRFAIRMPPLALSLRGEVAMLLPTPASTPLQFEVRLALGIRF